MSTGCTHNFYIVCLHVVNGAAEPRVFPYDKVDELGCVGEIYCADCDTISQQPGGWDRLKTLLHVICAHCMENKLATKAEVKA